MVVFPNSKINLGLNVVQKRGDGFHDIETVFYPIQLNDALEIIKKPDSNLGHSFSTSGLQIPGDPGNNICLKAYSLLKKEFPQLGSVGIYLHKAIPMGAGLGGGSSDGAAALATLNKLFNLGLSKEQLIERAAFLGSDCPFFIINEPCFARGRGEILERIAIHLLPYKLIIVNPDIHVATAEVFSTINPVLPSKSIKQIVRQPIETWKNELTNDFEESVFKKYPDIKSIKDELYRLGAFYCAMTGSGSTVFGIFDKDSNVEPSFPSTYFVKTIQTRY